MRSLRSEGEVISLLSLSEALASVLDLSGVVGGLMKSLYVLLLALEGKKSGDTYIFSKLIISLFRISIGPPIT